MLQNSTFLKTLEYVGDHPEVLQDAMEETKDDIQKILTAGKVLFEIAELAADMLSGVANRGIMETPKIIAGATWVSDQVQGIPLANQIGVEG